MTGTTYQIFSDVQRRRLRRHGLKDDLVDGFLRGDPVAYGTLTATSPTWPGNTEVVRAWLIHGLYKVHGPAPIVVRAMKHMWYGAHDYIGALLGLDAFRALAVHDDAIQDLPETFTAWRAEWAKPRGFLSPLRSWSVSEDGARHYCGKGKVLIHRQVERSEVLFYIPAHHHVSGVDEVVLAGAQSEDPDN